LVGIRVALFLILTSVRGETTEWLDVPLCRFGMSNGLQLGFSSSSSEVENLSRVLVDSCFLEPDVVSAAEMIPRPGIDGDLSLLRVLFLSRLITRGLRYSNVSIRSTSAKGVSLLT